MIPNGTTPAEFWEGALCSQTDPDLFFPDGQGDRRAIEARKICARCPILDRCRDYITEAERVEGRIFGIWSGMTDRERGDAREQPAGQLKPCGTVAAYARHNVNGETPCEACIDAKRAYDREWRARRKRAA